MKIGNYSINPLMLLLVFVPTAYILEFTHADPTWVFIVSCLAIIPLAGIMGEATEHLAERAGPGIGGLLNATFGNAAELIIALIALKNGLHDVVKASLTGSIIGNVLLVLGASIMAGGIKRERQHFDRTAAGLGASLMALSAIALIIPAVFDFIAGQTGRPQERELSFDIAVVLALIYALNLFFALRTHKHLFNNVTADDEKTPGNQKHTHAAWSVGRSVITLLVSTAFIGAISELLVGSVEHTAKEFGMTEVFIGVIVVAIIGNAAEHSSAIIMAVKNKMDLAINIAVGSSIQIALFVAPVLVFFSYIFGNPMDLLFTPFEVVSVVVSVWMLTLIAQDGETHWMEGVLCLGLYAIIGIAFFYLP
ncbi:calcium/proton exchanger [Ignavibacteria bacterium]|nr:calcium/proton exchanger [Bacteroidota bacterium]MCZ2133427.1 calcium/proton exchanger [Bacteroidota bacterium]